MLSQQDCGMLRSLTDVPCFHIALYSLYSVRLLCLEMISLLCWTSPLPSDFFLNYSSWIVSAFSPLQVSHLASSGLVKHQVISVHCEEVEVRGRVMFVLQIFNEGTESRPWQRSGALSTWVCRWTHLHCHLGDQGGLGSHRCLPPAQKLFSSIPCYIICRVLCNSPGDFSDIKK